MKYILIYFSLFLTLSCQNDHEIRLKGKIFGTYYSVITYGKEKEPEVLRKEIDQLLTRLDYIYSTYKSDSELSKLNNFHSEDTIGLTSELFNVLKISEEVYQDTDGFFDVTVGPIVNAWGFGPDGVQKRPSEKELKILSQLVGMDKIKLFDNGDIKKINKNIYIDLSAIAKGHAVDEVSEYLKRSEFKSALVEIGGEVRAYGKKPDGTDFRIGIEKPSEVQSGEIVNVVALDNMSLATSGSYRNYKKYQDKVFSHTIDPKTKKPAQNKVISVTVVHEKCVYADAYATALMAMGAKKALEFANNKGLGIYILVKNGEKIDTLTSNSFPKK
tara:strand:- start:83081 stop:84067 length:987 start_codon:yes stop_codon:yes gene_type:complete